MSAGLRIVLVDDHALVRAGLRSLLQAVPQVEVVGEAANGREALQLIDRVRPDVVLMDISMPGLNGFDAVRSALRIHPQTRILMLSMHEDRRYIREAFSAGAAGYLLKTAEREELELAVRTVSKGQRWLSRALPQQTLEALARGGDAVNGPPLTPRQRQVLQLIAEGNSTREIAGQLQISVKTVETHRAQLMERLEIHDVPGLVLYAVRCGMVHPDR